MGNAFLSSRWLIAFAAALCCVGLAALPARADCDGAVASASVLFETDREPLPDDQLFSGERGLDSRRRPIVTTGVLSAPVARRTEQLCSSREAFLSAIRRRFDGKRGRQVLLYIHGYYTTFDAAVENALTLQAALHFPGPVIVYSWPAKVTSLLTYANDESNAEWSMSHFADLLDLLTAEFRGMPISFAGHSLGSRFVTTGLRLLRFSKCSGCFGRAALFAADVDSDTLYGELDSMGECNSPPVAQPIASAPVVLYVSNKDRALHLSQRMHGHQRGGQAGSEMILCGGVDTIDVSYYKSSDHRNQHSYQVDERIDRDMAASFAGLPPSAASRNLRRVTRDGAVYYELIP